MTVLAVRRPHRRLVAVTRSASQRARPVGDRRLAMVRAVDRRPAAAAAVVALLAAVVAGRLAGPVAAGLAAGYAAGATAAVLRRRRGLRRSAADVAAVDAVAELAADLRAGAPPAAAVAQARGALAGSAAAAAAVDAAWQVSQRTGAPLAEVLDRVEHQLREAYRLRCTVAAHQAGAQATALLLAVLPAGGVGLGYGLDADPLDLLFRTPLGAACAGLAGALQLAGLAWTGRLSRMADR